MSNQKRTDWTGQRFGRLVAVRPADVRVVSGQARLFWFFRCDCGNEVSKAPNLVYLRKNASCGCNRPLKGEASVCNKVYRQCYADGDLSLSDFKELASKDCFYCGKPPSNNQASRCGKFSFSYSGLDRLDNAIGHNKGNVVPCCWPCNSLKGYRDMDQFLNLVDAIWIHRNGAANDSIGAIR